jgi:hypothetical protein
MRRTDFCREQSLKITAFDYWRRKLKTPKPDEKQLIAVGKVSGSLRPPTVHLRIGQRFILEFREDIGEETLGKLLSVFRDIT